MRNPMQWTGDRNGGVSRAGFAQLYAPPLMDPGYGDQAVNVEGQPRPPPGPPRRRGRVLYPAAGQPGWWARAL